MPFYPNWDSLSRYTVPQWFQDAKLGIFVHWGVYSVPAFGNEWYPRNMYREGTPEFAHHRETWGPQDRFGYKDFIPLFTGARFDPEGWVDLFREAGARYVGHTHPVAVNALTCSRGAEEALAGRLTQWLAEPARPVTIRAESTGPSSRIIESATAVPSIPSEPNLVRV